jgi:ribosomal protein S18 acetylase RimI-like enzyme
MDLSSRTGVRGQGSGVRAGRPADVDAILALEAAAFPAEDRFPRASWRRLLASASAMVLVQPGADGIDAGIAWLLRRGSSLARMYSLAVHPRARGRGLAKRLVAASLRRFPAGIDTLGLEVRSDNAAAVGLYCALGFIETARLPRYYGDGRDGIRMRAARGAVRQMLRRQA